MPPKKKTAKKSVKKDPKKDVASAYLSNLRKQGMVGDITKKILFVPTGSWVLNRLIGDGTHTNSPGGFPRGYITELFGNEGCGKTTIALHACQQALLAGERVIYADFEHSLRTQFQYIKNIGIDLDPTKFIHLTPSCLEDGVKEIGKGLKPLRPALVVVDSVTTMLPKSAFENEADDTIQLGLHAKLTGTFLNWISKHLETYDTALLLLNQLRSTIKTSKYDTGPEETTSGGRAPKFFSSVRIQLKSNKSETVEEKSIITGIKEKKKINQIVKASVIKNKLDVPWKSGPLYIAFGQGIDNIMSLLTLAVNKNVIKKKGAWFTYEDPNEKYSFNLQGIHKVKKYVEEHPEVLDIMKPYLLPSEDTDEMIKIRDELEAKGEENLTDEEKENLKRLKEMNLDDYFEDSSDDEDLDEIDDSSIDDLSKSLDKATNKYEEGEE